MSCNGWYMVDGETKPASEWERPGKPEWPDIMTVAVSRSKALELISLLARAMANESDERPINVVFWGKLEREP